MTGEPAPPPPATGAGLGAAPLAPALAAVLAAVSAAVLLLPGATSAQQRVEVAELEASVAEEVVALFNDPATLHFRGPATLPAAIGLDGDVAVLGGPVTLGGVVQGSLLVINGDLVVAEGARVEGDVTVVGGDARGDGLAGIRGILLVIDEPLRYAEREGRIRVRDEPEEDERLPGLRFGRSELTVRTAGAYNRVDGLSVLAGPRIEAGDDHPFRFEALALFRTEAGLSFDDDELGYRIGVEQRFGREPRTTVGLSFASSTEPMGRWGLSELESSLSTFLLHKDFQDHYFREGWSAFARLRSARLPLALLLEYRDEDHRFAPVSSPWSLRRNDDPWRPQPLVAEGELRSATAELVLDTRNDPEEPTDGWYVTASLTRGLGGGIELPLVEPPATPEDPSPDPLRPGTADETFSAGFFDLRRYARVSPDADLSFRVAFGGALDGEPLPPQLQHALGGEGTLPGYGLFDLDCGARSRRFLLDRAAFDDDRDPVQEVFPAYGCDRAFLLQAEYRGRFSVDIDFGPDDEEEWEEEWSWYPAVDLSPAWALFLNAGKGWSETASDLDTRTVADVGAGLILGDLGIYWAWPLNGDDRDLNFFVRLQRRF